MKRPYQLPPLLRQVLALATLVAWAVTWPLLPHPPGDPGAFGASLGWALALACSAAGLVFGAAVVASAPHPPSARLAVWRAVASVATLVVGGALLFPPRSVPLSSAGAQWFIAAAALTAVGTMLDIFGAVGPEDA